MRTWLITGVSSGLGKAMAQTAIEQGDFVVGTFRQQDQADRFNDSFEGRAHGMLLDVTRRDEIDEVISFVNGKYGVDVLVNNAGYGLAGAIEETSIEECREIFEANFFGTLQITQRILTIMRGQKSGHIIQVSSHGGFKSFAGFGIYNASKFAVEGFSEALALEVASLGIKVTIVQPGPFRTNFAGKGFVMAKGVIDDYRETAGMFRNKIASVHGKQEGDPVKAARAIFDVTLMEHPPLRLPLGITAIHSIEQKLENVKTDLERFRSVAIESTFG